MLIIGLMRYARWTGSPGTPKGWPTQEAGFGRTPVGEGGPNGPTGFLTLSGEEWSPPGIGPRNLNMIECERKPNGTRNEHERSGGQQQEQEDLEVLLRPHRRRTPDGGEIRIGILQKYWDVSTVSYFKPHLRKLFEIDCILPSTK